MPDKYRKMQRADPVIHECVHFLQHQTTEEERGYINCKADRSNYREYISQRCEMEAHIVQLAYRQQAKAVHPSNAKEINVFLHDYHRAQNEELAIERLLFFHAKGEF